MQESQSSVNIDSKLAAKALNRAKKKNISNTFRGLYSYLINLYANGDMVIDFDPLTFLWNVDKRTSMVYEKDKISVIQATLSEKRLPTGYDFIVNLLLTNFLKNTE